MKYAALLSGGKDSCFNLLHCQKNGHQLVAAASLRPEPGKDEIDSYMYQTVGQDVIEVVARALNVPLYRRVISGGALHQGAEYGARAVHGPPELKGDETEDLYELLAAVLEDHPEVEGVSVGAILSNYQRVRVEHVCRRLKLTCLAYLWQRDQGELLSEMIEVGLTAVVIKVAGIGLAAKHLGKTLQEMQPTFQKLNTLYGSHICGEGGEYETLTIDSPMFTSKILLNKVEIAVHSESDLAPVAYLRVKEAELVPKGATPPAELPVPQILDDKYSEGLEKLHRTVDPPAASLESSGGVVGGGSNFEMRSRQVQDWIAVTNVQRTSNLAVVLSVEEEVIECCRNLAAELKKYGQEIHDCANINVFLSSINIFARVNAAYGSFFGSSPPARACVAVSLPEPFQIRLDAIAFAEKRPEDRQAHHVQGLSYWAPANIGPYSQAILAQERLFVSGQIGLIPNNLALAESLQLETVLSCQHVDRIVEAVATNTGSNWRGIPHLNIYWFEAAGDLLSTKDINKILKEEDIPSLFVAVAGLPKGAKVEKQTLFHTGRIQVNHGDEDTEVKLVVETANELHQSGKSLLRSQRRTLGDYIVSLVYVKGELIQSLPLGSIAHGKGALLSARLFYHPSRTPPLKVRAITLAFGLQDAPITEVPCHWISSDTEDDWDSAICLLSHVVK